MKSPSALILQLSHHLVAKELQIIKILNSPVPHRDFLLFIFFIC